MQWSPSCTVGWAQNQETLSKHGLTVCSCHCTLEWYILRRQLVLWLPPFVKYNPAEQWLVHELDFPGMFGLMLTNKIEKMNYKHKLKNFRNQIITLCKWMSTKSFPTNSIRTIRFGILAYPVNQRNIMLLSNLENSFLTQSTGTIHRESGVKTVKKLNNWMQLWVRLERVIWVMGDSKLRSDHVSQRWHKPKPRVTQTQGNPWVNPLG